MGPIDNPRFVTGMWRRNSDAISLDLEDAVCEPNKAYARTLPREAYHQVSKGGASHVSVRINHMYWAADLEGTVWPGLGAISYPKGESAEQMRRMDPNITDLERRRGMRPGTVAVRPAVETIRGVVNLDKLATSNSRVRSVGGGGVGFDMARDLAIEALAVERRALDDYAIGEGYLVAGALGLNPSTGVGTVAIVVGDVVTGDSRFDQAAANRKAGIFGGVGLSALHPNSVGPLNRGYTPPPEDVEEAEQTIALFEELNSRGEVQGELLGKVVDKWEAERARKLMEWAQACARTERDKTAARARAEAEEEIAAERS
jgi:citrate lyase subunit beta/citryl-CoA lyase